jgi:hypothetical protein
LNPKTRAADTNGFTVVLRVLGKALLANGRAAEAVPVLLEDIDLIHSTGMPPLMAHDQLADVLEIMAGVHEARGDHDLALATRAEVVARWGALARLRPDAFAARHAAEQTALAQVFAERGHPPGAALVAERDAAQRLGLDTT